MASPVVEQAVESSTNSAGTSHTITAPTWTADQLLIIILDKGSTAATMSQSSGPTVTELLDENNANGLYIAYRFMQAGDSGNIVLTSSASTRTASIAYRISGASRTKAPEIGTTGTGTSTGPDPPASAAPAGGVTRDFLVIAFAGMAGEEADDDTWGNTSPTDYTPATPRQKSCGTAGVNLGGLILSAERAISTSASQDPGAFNVDVSAAWRSQTILVYPHLEIDAASGSYVFTGTAATIVADRMINAAFSVFAITDAGTQTRIVAGRVIDSQPGSYVLTGTDASLIGGRVVSADPGAFVVTGIDVTFIYGQGGYEIDAQPGTFTLTGVLAGVAADRAINAEPGSYAVSGVVASLIADHVLSASPGAFVLTGTAASVVADRFMEALPTSFTVSGQPAGVVVDRVIQTSPGEFVVTGVATTLDYSGFVPVAARLRLLLDLGE